jgi:hypothetical protein
MSVLGLGDMFTFLVGCAFGTHQQAFLGHQMICQIMVAQGLIGVKITL